LFANTARTQDKHHGVRSIRRFASTRMAIKVGMEWNRRPTVYGSIARQVR